MPSTCRMLPIDAIQLDMENPRIKHCLEIYGNNITSEAIALALCMDASGSYTHNALKESIRENKGIIEPIIVNKKRDNSYVVVEGNTRLQIYKDFHDDDPAGPWSEIMAIIHDDLSEQEIHAIRLQAHLVGPREWDPYSKAKYLYQLVYEERLPRHLIESFCGGQRTEINKYINAYIDMNEIYTPLAEQNGYDLDPAQFSKFMEFQKDAIKRALEIHHYEKEDFAKWVLERKIDTAQNVRKLPEVLHDPDARRIFLRDNIGEAIRFLDSKRFMQNSLTDATIYELAEVLTSKLGSIPYQEVIDLKANENKLTIWESLTARVDFVNKAIGKK